MIFNEKPYRTISLPTGVIISHFKGGRIDVSETRDCDDFNTSDCCGARQWNGTDICDDCMEHASFSGQE